MLLSVLRFLFSVVALFYQYFPEESFKKRCEPGDTRKKWKYNQLKEAAFADRTGPAAEELPKKVKML